MKIRLLSDLHLDLWKDKAPDFQGSGGQGDADLVLLAGDISRAARGVDWAATTFKNSKDVLLIHGNHEAYSESSVERVIQKNRDAALTSNVKFLQCDEVILAGGAVRVLGACLWTDYALFGDDTRQESMEAYDTKMSDAQRVRTELGIRGFRKLKARDVLSFHRTQLAWLKARLEEPFDGKTVVMTHHAPSARSLDQSYPSNDDLHPSYASNLDYIFLNGKIDVYVHGHVHVSNEYFVGKTRVISNPMGYRLANGAPENKSFDPFFSFELDV